MPTTTIERQFDDFRVVTHSAYDDTQTHTEVKDFFYETPERGRDFTSVDVFPSCEMPLSALKASGHDDWCVLRIGEDTKVFLDTKQVRRVINVLMDALLEAVTDEEDDQ